MGEIKTDVHAKTTEIANANPGDLVAGPEADVEIVDQTDVFDEVIAAANKLEAYAKAQDQILNIIIKRTFAGDWITHDKRDTPEGERKANMGAAAAERIANFLGVTETWVKDKDGRALAIKEWSDDKKHYSYTYEADFSFRGVTRHAVGRVGTRDKFFGFAHGQWKPLDQVEEDDLKTAAYRDCIKKGVTRLFGLRNIPLTKLKALGYDISLVKMAEFEGKGKQIDKTDLKANDKGLIEKTIVVVNLEKFEGTTKSTGKPWVRFDLTDKEGVKYTVFAAGDSKRILVLSDRMEDQKPVKIGFKIVPYNNRENYQIEAVEGAES